MSPHNNPAKDFLLYQADAPHLKRLPEAWRAMLEMATNDGMKHRDIAGALGLPIGTVKSRIHRARAAVIKMRLENAMQKERTDG